MSRDEYENALRSLVMASGTSLDRDSIKLRADCRSLRSELKAAQTQVSVLESECAQHQEKIDTLSRSSTCPVCLSGLEDGVELNCALVPCGHLFCSNCASRLSECATCKRTVTGRLRIFPG